MAQSKQSSDIHHQHNITNVDDFYFSALFDETADIFPISDSKYAEELQFQEALMSSTKSIPQTTTSTTETTTFASSSSLLISSPSPQLLVQALVPFLAAGELEDHTTEELGESSQMFCEICAERKPADEKFTPNSECQHSFCSSSRNSRCAWRDDRSGKS